jgi:hypothetical protein
MQSAPRAITVFGRPLRCLVVPATKLSLVGLSTVDLQCFLGKNRRTEYKINSLDKRKKSDCHHAPVGLLLNRNVDGATCRAWKIRFSVE